MSDVAIRCENLGKQYRIGTIRQAYGTLRDVVTDVSRRLWRGRDAATGPSGEPTIWALRGLDLDIPAGQVLGVIGRNGAGKSTLLKILSRITSPTEGRVTLRGRVGSLLEVGTGFHPELTGRENIFLNGAILGMSRKEIRAKLDEIVAFAEIDKFLDTPVKRYSSGMYVRLGFAVAAHLEPEILLVDEVLAVGDAAFQRKCLAKMSEATQAGRTVLFVSHNMEMIGTLADRCVLLDGGRLVADGSTAEIVAQHLQNMTEFLATRAQRDEDLPARLLAFELATVDDLPPNVVEMGKPFTLSLDCEFREAMRDPYVSVEISTERGAPLYQFVSTDDHMDLGGRTGTVHLELKMNEVKLYPGRYFAKFGICNASGQLLDFIDPAFGFEVVPGAAYGVTRYLNPRGGSVFEPASWTFRESPHDD
ncbi:MAG: ABC transporter ATP-binding protein [Candidatus Lernaella stagnicola]|nr:ABC transporter ATP-binding protein [Candidatus Lernaella stagnicola]